MGMAIVLNENDDLEWSATLYVNLRQGVYGIIASEVHSASWSLTTHSWNLRSAQHQTRYFKDQYVHDVVADVVGNSDKALAYLLHGSDVAIVPVSPLGHSSRLNLTRRFSA